MINVHIDVGSSIESGSFDRLLLLLFFFGASFTNFDFCLRPYVGARSTRVERKEITLIQVRPKRNIMILRK